MQYKIIGDINVDGTLRHIVMSSFSLVRLTMDLSIRSYLNIAPNLLVSSILYIMSVQKNKLRYLVESRLLLNVSKRSLNV